jgi:hypothetical protein
MLGSLAQVETRGRRLARERSSSLRTGRPLLRSTSTVVKPLSMAALRVLRRARRFIADELGRPQPSFRNLA